LYLKLLAERCLCYLKLSDTTNQVESVAPSVLLRSARISHSTSLWSGHHTHRKMSLLPSRTHVARDLKLAKSNFPNRI
jgi:hypothetical protein